MSWDQVVQQDSFESWLSQQIATPAANDIQALLNLISNDLDLLFAPLETLSPSDLVADPVMGLDYRYPDLGAESKPSAFVTPAAALAILCLNNKATIDVRRWLQYPNLLWQLLLLQRPQWESLGIQVQDIPVDCIKKLLQDDQLGELYHAHWMDELTCVAGIKTQHYDENAKSMVEITDCLGDNLVKVTASGVVDIPHEDLVNLIETSQFSGKDAARKIFLLVAEYGVISSSLLANLVSYGLDLNELPIPFCSDDHIEHYWLRSKAMAEGERLMALGNTALNGAIIHLSQQEFPDLSLLSRIAHPQSDLALTQLLDARPDLISFADQAQKSSFMRIKIDV